MKRVTSTLAKGFICKICVEAMKETVEPAEELTFCDQVKLMKVLVSWGIDQISVVEVKRR